MLRVQHGICNVIVQPCLGDEDQFEVARVDQMMEIRDLVPDAPCIKECCRVKHGGWRWWLSGAGSSDCRVHWVAATARTWHDDSPGDVVFAERMIVLGPCTWKSSLEGRPDSAGLLVDSRGWLGLSCSRFWARFFERSLKAVSASALVRCLLKYTFSRTNWDGAFRRSLATLRISSTSFVLLSVECYEQGLNLVFLLFAQPIGRFYIRCYI